MTTHVLGVILKGYPRISEPFITNELRLLEQAGYSLRLYSIHNPGEEVENESADRVSAPISYLPPHFKGHELSLILDGAVAAFRHPLGFFRATWTALRWCRKNRTWAVLKQLLQAAHLVRHHLEGGEVDFLYAHFAHNPTTLAWLASIITGLPFAFSAHAKDIWARDPRQLAAKIQDARMVLTCTDVNRAYLKSLNPHGAPVRLAYHGVDLNLFSEKNVREAEPPYSILSVARLVDKKGLDTVLRALALLKNRGVEFTFRHVGEGKRARRLQNSAEELGLSDRVEWLGALPRKKVVEEYLQSDVLVLGCRVMGDGDRDGIPNVLAEAMAVGLPLVSTTVSAIPELVRHEKDGLLIEPDDPEAMADALERTLKDRELRLRMRANGPGRIREMFDADRTIHKVLEGLTEAGACPASATLHLERPAAGDEAFQHVPRTVPQTAPQTGPTPGRSE